MKKLTKAFIVVLSMIVFAFPVSGKSLTKKYVTVNNVAKVIYVATNYEILLKRELSKQFFEVYSLAYETIFGEP